jgi:hypothetical protein
MAQPLPAEFYSARDEINALGRARADALARQPFGAGGVHGAMLQDRADIEGAFLDRLMAHEGRRQLALRQRAWDEEDRQRRMRAAAEASLAQGAVNLHSTAGGLALGMLPAPRPMQERDEDRAQNVGRDPFTSWRWGL